MDISRRDFLAGLTAAPFVSGCSKHKHKPAMVLAVDPQLQLQEENDIHLHHSHVFTPDQQSLTNLTTLARQVHDAMPAALPKARFLPPMPKIFVEDLNIRGRRVIAFKSAFASSENGAALSFIISEGAMKDFDPEEMKMAMANHFAHAILKLNPNLVAEYKIPVTGIITNDLETQFITPEPGPEFNAYKSQLCADDIAVRLTRNPNALTSLLTKMDLQGFNKGAPGPSVAARIESAETAGRKLGEKESRFWR